MCLIKTKLIFRGRRRHAIVNWNSRALKESVTLYSQKTLILCKHKLILCLVQYDYVFNAKVMTILQSVMSKLEVHNT